MRIQLFLLIAYCCRDQPLQGVLYDNFLHRNEGWKKTKDEPSENTAVSTTS